MKLKDKKELRLKSIPELTAMVTQNFELLSEFKISKSQNKLKNTRSIFHTRKKVAQILTIIKEKELLKSLEVKNDKR